MSLIFFFYSLIILWTAGLPDWIVAYATGVAQLGIWVTAISFFPFSAFWVSLKRQFFAESSPKSRTQWNVSLKVSIHFCYFIFVFYKTLHLFLKQREYPLSRELLL
jgi:hypothetical protein